MINKNSHPTAKPISPGFESQTRFLGLNGSPAVLRLTILALLALVFSHVTVRGQTVPTPSPESEEITRLRDEKTRAELERDIAAAKKAELESKYPKPTTSPLSGETKINDGAAIESDMVSYVSMAYAADRLVKALRESNLPISKLAIYSKPDIELLLNYNVTTNQIELVRQQYCKLLRQDLVRCPAQMGARSGNAKAFTLPTIASSLLGAFVDLTALLRTNVTVTGHSLEISESALVSEVFRAARSQDGLNNHPDLFYPAAFPPNINFNTRSQILGQLEVLYDLKAKTAGLMQGLTDNLKKTSKASAKVEEFEAGIGGIKQEQRKAQDELNTLLHSQKVYGRRTPFEAHQRIQQLRKQIADLSKSLFDALKSLDEKKAELKTLEERQAGLLAQLAINLETADVEDTIAKLKLLNERFDQLVATLIKTDPATGINSLTAYIKAENLRQALSSTDGSGYWLQLAVIKAGGNNRIKSNLVTDIFTSGSRLSHSGGVIVQYNLYDLNGRSLVSDTLTEYAGYVKAGKIKRLPNPSAADQPKSIGDKQAKRKVDRRDSESPGSQ